MTEIESKPLSEIWSRLSGVGVGITDATFGKFLANVFDPERTKGLRNINVFFASNEQIELRILKKIDPKVQTSLSIGDVLYQQDTNVDTLKTTNRRTQRAFNAAVINYNGSKFADME